MSWARIAAGGARPAPPRASAAVPAGLPRQTQSSANSTATGREATPPTATQDKGNAEGNVDGVRNTPPVAAAAESENKGGGVVEEVSGGTTTSLGEGGGGKEAVSGDGRRDRSTSSSPKTTTTTGRAGVTASVTGVGGGAEAGVEAEAGKGDAADAVVDEAALEKAKVEAEAKAAENAKVLAEQRWRSLLGRLGREEIPAGTGPGAGAGAGVGNELVHRGLVNTGNSCFRSAVLQALLACEPFTR